MDNMKKSSPPSSSQPKKASSTSVLIKKIVITNVNVDVVNGLTGGSVSKLPPIPRIELTNVSSESGVSADQIIGIVLQEVLKEVLKTGNPVNLLKDAAAVPKGILKDLIMPFKP
jgi:hypothetical protein